MLKRVVAEVPVAGGEVVVVAAALAVLVAVAAFTISS